METVKSLIAKNESDFIELKQIMLEILDNIKCDYNVWFQSRLKSVESLYEKIYVRRKNDISDIIGFRIIYPWTKSLRLIANIIKDNDKLKIIREKITEQNKVIYLYGITDKGNMYEIQFWPTILYTCFEYEHDKIYKPANNPSDKQIENSKIVRKKEHEIQNYIDNNCLVPYSNNKL